jgi:hypothetical protein
MSAPTYVSKSVDHVYRDATTPPSMFIIELTPGFVDQPSLLHPNGSDFRAPTNHLDPLTDSNNCIDLACRATTLHRGDVRTTDRSSDTTAHPSSLCVHLDATVEYDLE